MVITPDIYNYARPIVAAKIIEKITLGDKSKLHLLLFFQTRSEVPDVNSPGTSLLN